MVDGCGEEGQMEEGKGGRRKGEGERRGGGGGKGREGWASEMAQWEEELVTNSEDPSSIPGTHIVEGGTSLPQDILSNSTHSKPHECLDLLR